MNFNKDGFNSSNKSNFNISNIFNKTAIVIGIAVVAIIIFPIFFVQGIQDKAFGLEEQINSAISDINVQEKRRADLIPNLVDCVKEYDKHEYETLMAIVNGRSKNGLNETDITEIQTMINAVAESYPELKSSENYKELMNELTVTENTIAGYRSNYNKFVKQYNQYTRTFLNRTALGILGYEKVNYEMINFEVSHDAPKDLFG